jgi:hypothetical protein
MGQNLGGDRLARAIPNPVGLGVVVDVEAEQRIRASVRVGGVFQSDALVVADEVDLRALWALLAGGELALRRFDVLLEMQRSRRRREG